MTTKKPRARTIMAGQSKKSQQSKKALRKCAWPPLEPGDKVELIMPGFACTKEELKGAISFIKSWGLEPKVPKDLFGKDPICANTDKVRIKHIKKALEAKDSKAIWCLRGGYGCARLIPELMKLKRPGKVKPIIGYSDITVLHTFVAKKWNWPSIHGPLLDRLGLGTSRSIDALALQKLIFGEQREIEFNQLKALNSAARKAKTINAPLVGGNLSVIESLIATPLDHSGKGKIVFFEDVGERGYRVDKMLVHLKQTGFFKGVKAVVFGEFIEGRERNGKRLWKQAQERIAKELSIPVLYGVPVGHGQKQHPLPLNTKARLKTGAKPQLRIMI